MAIIDVRITIACWRVYGGIDISKMSQFDEREVRGFPSRYWTNKVILIVWLSEVV